MKLRQDSCQTIRDLLPLHVGNDLEPRRSVAVDRHLESCTTCFREFRELASMRGLLGVLAEEPLPQGVLHGFAEEVMARIAIGERGPAAEAPRPATILRPFTWQRVAAVAAGLLVSAAGWQLVSDSQPIATPVREMSSPTADVLVADAPTHEVFSTPFTGFDVGTINTVAGGDGAPAARGHGARQGFIPLHLVPDGRLPSDVDRIVMDMAGSLGAQSLVGSGLVVDYNADGSLRKERERER